MKKLITALCWLLACIFVFTACGKEASVYGGSYFLTNYTELGVGVVDETARYSVTFATKTTGEGEEKTNENKFISLSVSDTSYYETKLKNTTYNDEACYLLETLESVSGTYTIGETETPFSNVISAKCYFLGVNNDLKPLYSERNVKAYTPVMVKVDEYEIKYFEYTVKTSYDGDTAKVEFLPDSEKSTGTFGIDAGVTEYSEYNKEAYVDNELIFFAPRAYSLNSSFTTTFFSVDAMSKSNRGITASVKAEEPSKSFSYTEKSYKVNGKQVNSAIVAYSLQFKIDSNYAKANSTAYYADKNERDQRAIMLELSIDTYYDLGTFTYSIDWLNTNAD